MSRTLYTAWQAQSAGVPRVPRPARKPRKLREPVLSVYKRWWQGKRVRLPNDVNKEFKLVKDVEFYGPPSGVYGTVQLVYADGSARLVHTFAHRPRKSDVEVAQSI